MTSPSRLLVAGALLALMASAVHAQNPFANTPSREPAPLPAPVVAPVVVAPPMELPPAVNPDDPSLTLGIEIVGSVNGMKIYRTDSSYVFLKPQDAPVDHRKYVLRDRKPTASARSTSAKAGPGASAPGKSTPKDLPSMVGKPTPAK